MRHAISAFVCLALAACDWPPKPIDGGTAGAGAPPSGGSPPAAAVIDSLDLSANAQALNGYYNIYGSISFHDDKKPVHAVRVHVPVIGKSYDFGAGDVPSAIGLPLDIVVSADIPLSHAGPTNFQVTLVDADGAESTPPKLVTVDLQ